MRKYSLPCIISLVVAALYNIVDQIFIANADYLGSCGNAANTVVFPLTVVALAIAVMIGDGVFLPILLPLFFGLDGVLYSFPTAGVLTFLLTVIVIAGVYRELGRGSGSESRMTEEKAAT